ncbi:hypothetical protein H9P43_006717 [Blastocladiella emersonii ATCC 22665]|nr:hypothetical protein H9P43_006696 [Blastocladiella emersonii ATCC 22665]KAI9175356.1 hypothetical protein H9P43_006717 [Blastocladiella emersonii ATCC 22665]
MDTPSANELGREWLDSPARRVNPPSKLPADLPPAFESGSSYEWCESCGVHFRTEALKRHKKSVIHRANVVQYAQWTAARSASAASTTSQASTAREQPQKPPGATKHFPNGPIEMSDLMQAIETSGVDLSSFNPNMVNAVFEMLTDKNLPQQLSRFSDSGLKVFTHDPKTGRPGTLNTCGAATLTTEELARRFTSAAFDEGANIGYELCCRVNCLRIATLLAMTKKLSDPDSELDIFREDKELVPDSLTSEEHDAREAAINTFCMFKYDRKLMLSRLGINTTKPSDKEFVRDYHSWADSLDIQAIKADNEEWMLGRTARDCAFGLAMGERFQRVKLREAASGPAQQAPEPSRSARRAQRK